MYRDAVEDVAALDARGARARAQRVGIRHGLPPARPLRPPRLRAHPRHDDLRRRRQVRQRRHHGPRRRARAADRHVPRRRRQPDRHGRRLLRRRLGGDPRPGARGPPRPRARGHQGAHGDGRRAQRRRALAPSPDPRLRGEPAPARHRPHRPLPGARVGRRDADGGDARRARRPRARRQGPLRRLLELLGLADVEGARRLRAARARALRQPAGLLLAAVARRGVRDRARVHRPGRRDPRLEPARGRPAVGQVPPRAAGARRARAT